MTEAELEAVHQTIVRLESRWTGQIPDGTVWYPYDPLPPAQFVPAARIAAWATPGRKFLDLGCGIGTKLAFMRSLRWQVAGIDRHQPYLDAAAELIPEADLKLGNIEDITEVDADFVYMYRPAVDKNRELEIERRVVELMRPGTVLFLPASHVEQYGLEPLRDDIGVKTWHMPS